MATAHPHLEPDPFDEKIEEMLRDPELIADLDDQRAKLKREELKGYTNEEVRERLRALHVPLVNETASDLDR